MRPACRRAPCVLPGLGMLSRPPAGLAVLLPASQTDEYLPDRGVWGPGQAGIERAQLILRCLGWPIAWTGPVIRQVRPGTGWLQ